MSRQVPDDVTGAATPVYVEIANKYANRAGQLVSDDHGIGVNEQIIKTAMYEFLQEVLQVMDEAGKPKGL